MDSRIFHLWEKILANPAQNWTLEEIVETIELSNLSLHVQIK